MQEVQKQTHKKEQAITNKCLGDTKVRYIMNTIFLTSGKNKWYLISLYVLCNSQDVNGIYLLILDTANRPLFVFYTLGFF